MLFTDVVKFRVNDGLDSLNIGMTRCTVPSLATDSQMVAPWCAASLTISVAPSFAANASSAQCAEDSQCSIDLVAADPLKPATGCTLTGLPEQVGPTRH